MDSALGRTLKLIERDGVEKHEAAIDATRLYVNDAMARVEAAAITSRPLVPWLIRRSPSSATH